MSDKPCPNCGHCPTCGRKNYTPNHWPWGYWPWYPPTHYWQRPHATWTVQTQPLTTTGGQTGTTGYFSNTGIGGVN